MTWQLENLTPRPVAAGDWIVVHARPDEFDANDPDALGNMALVDPNSIGGAGGAFDQLFGGAPDTVYTTTVVIRGGTP